MIKLKMPGLRILEEGKESKNILIHGIFDYFIVEHNI